MELSSYGTKHILFLGRGMIDDPGIDRSTDREGNPCFK